MAKAKFKVEGMKELEKSIKKLGDVPQKYINLAAQKGIKPTIQQAKVDAPENTGALKKGIIKVGERPSGGKRLSRGKKVYRLVFDRKMNHIFQKKSAGNSQFRMYHGQGRSRKDPRWEKKISYYPVSQEYGYFTKNGRYIPGFFFGHNALKDNVGKMEKIIVETMKTKIDAEIAKGGLK